MILKISRELKTGIVAIVAISLFVWGFNFLKGQNIFAKTKRTFKTEYANVQGLNTSSVVTINGVVVGKVLNITFSKETSKKGALEVVFSIDNDFEFSKNSIAKIYSTSLMGGKSLAVVPSYEGETAMSGDILKGEIESDIFSTASEMLNPLQAKFENVISNIDSLMVGLNDVLDVNSRNHLKASIIQLNSTLTTFNQAGKKMDNILASNANSLNATISNAEKITNDFSKISENLASVNFAETVQNLEKTLANVNSLLGNIENGEGTIGKLMTDDQMYVNLENASKELEELLREFKEHPKRFVHFSLFGKKDKGFQKKSSVDKNQK